MVSLNKIGIIFVILVLLIGGAFAASTVFVSFNQDSENGTLRVLGSLDSASITDLNIRVIDKPSNDLFLQYTLPGTETNDLFNTTTLRYRHDFNNVNDWDANVYEIRVVFSSGPATFTTFDIPYILNLQAQVNELDQNILDLEAAVALLDSNSATFATDINNIYTILAIYDANLIDLQNQITDLNNDMNIELANLQSQIDTLDSRLTSVESTLNAMTHGTIWLAYDFNGNTLRVKGEFPVGTASITLKVRDMQQQLLM